MLLRLCILILILILILCAERRNVPPSHAQLILLPEATTVDPVTFELHTVLWTSAPVRCMFVRWVYLRCKLICGGLYRRVGY